MNINKLLTLLFLFVASLSMFTCVSENLSEIDETPKNTTSIKQALSSKLVGVHATKYYQSTWLGFLAFQWNMTNNFVNTIDNYDQVLFYYNLNGKQAYWHDDRDDETSLDSVDLFFATTHGDIDSNNAKWAMYNNNVWANSSQMRLGDDGRKLSIFTTYSCRTMTMDDLAWRWRSIFRGGLRMACGMHDDAAGGSGMSPVGTYYAVFLQMGTLVDAWGLATTSIWSLSPAIAATTANNSTNCYSRLNTMSWMNYSTKSRYRDSAIGYYCYEYWN